MRNHTFQWLLLLACPLWGVCSVHAATKPRPKKVKSISQFGITWNFDKKYPAGQFANGDYWVVGPVKLIGIAPPSIVSGGRTINGAMINPSPNSKQAQGFDSLGKAFDPALNVARPKQSDLSVDNPLVVPVHSSLMSTISIPGPLNWTPVKVAAILTVLKSAPPTGSFRPPYSGKKKIVKFNKKQLDYSLLGKLKPVAGTPNIASSHPEIAFPHQFS